MSTIKHIREGFVFINQFNYISETIDKSTKTHIMETNFYIKKEELKDVTLFIKNKLISSRFKHNPILFNNKYNISLTLTVEDYNKLSMYMKGENPKPVKKKSIMKSIADKMGFDYVDLRERK